MRIIFTLLIFIHGAIHLLGFFKAFGIATDAVAIKSISKPLGIIWLMTMFLFLSAGLFYLVGSKFWSYWALIAATVSQVLIMLSWGDTKFGTLPNVLILILAILALASQCFEHTYHKMVRSSMNTQSAHINDEILQFEEIQSLPKPVQRYLEYVGAVGKPKVRNFKLTFEGEMRSKDQDWFKFTSEQHNFVVDPGRLFFMKGRVKGIPTNGLHVYGNGEAKMLIKVFSLFPVANHEGDEMVTTETVTFFNDLCLFAPSALIDHRIEWETLDDLTVSATFKTEVSSIQATLFFNEVGQLVNFVSSDRTEVNENRKLKFSTPCAYYTDFSGFKLPSYGEATWHYEEGPFVYGRFFLQHVEYNGDL